MLKLGEIVQGKLIESIDPTHWIVSFRGNLIQVRNLSPLKFEKDKLVQLKVVQEKPLQLQVIGRVHRSLGKIDLKI